jgi:hypothetical protein
MASVENVPLVVRSWLETQARRLGQELVVTRIDDEADCRVFYWYSDAAARGSRDSRHLLAGNGPLILDQGGQLWMTGSAHTMETYLADFRSDRRLVRTLPKEKSSLQPD